MYFNFSKLSIKLVEIYVLSKETSYIYFYHSTLFCVIVLIISISEASLLEELQLLCQVQDFTRSPDLAADTVRCIKITSI